jgi:putative acetyltransferase
MKILIMNNYTIRPILEKDNTKIEAVIKQVLRDFNVPEKGTALADNSLSNLYAYYQKPRAIYFVIENAQKNILGGAGIAQLDNCELPVCELQKMYFLPIVRGKGLGTRMMQMCLQKAKIFLFKGCYLETMPYMKAAQNLYTRSGFKYIDNPMGDTGHYSCPVYMYKEL